MPIPKFNAYGLLPPGIHPATLEEIRRVLGFSPKRQSLIQDGLKPVIEELVGLKARELHLDGSFVTSRISPGDIDGYVLTESISPLYAEMAERYELWKERHRMDIWPAATDFDGEGSRGFFEELFGHTKSAPPAAKGLLKLSLRRVTHVFD